MNLFVVVYNDPGLRRRIVETHPDRHHELREGVCAIASQQATPAGVCRELDFAQPPSDESSPPALAGVVVRLHEYYGHWDLALWQRLEAWANSA